MKEFSNKSDYSTQSYDVGFLLTTELSPLVLALLTGLNSFLVVFVISELKILLDAA